VTHSYLLHGMTLSSEVALAEPATTPTGAADLVVTIGAPRPAADIDEDRILLRMVGNRVIYEAAPLGAQWLVQAPGVASFDIDDHHIRVHPDSAMPDPAVLPLLLAGTGLSFFLMINGEFCLHAGAVEVDGACMAFAGSSGRGKTTMAALACAAGYPLFADDLLRVDARNGSTVCAHRGSSEIRLRPAAAHLADGIAGPRRVTVDERTAVSPRRSEHALLPLSAIVLPRPDRGATAVHARRLDPPAAFGGLAECPRLTGWTHGPTLENELDHLVRLSGDVPVVEVTMPWTDELHPSLAEAVIREAGVLSR
jgi:hypothetical protein